MRVEMKYNYAVVGSRSFENYEIVKQYLDKYNVQRIVSGGARGADQLAERYAKEHNCDLVVIPADWDTYGKRAGFLRNQEIVKLADAVIAFWDGESLGTSHTLKLAREKGLPIRIILPNGSLKR